MPSTFPIPRFGGLRLDVDVEEVGATGAIDLLDVAPPFDGVLRTRWGSLKLNATTVSATGYQAIYHANTSASLTGEVLGARASGGNILIDKILGTGGTTSNIGSYASAGGVIMSWTSLGTPTATNVYFTSASAVAADTIHKTNGTAISTGTGKPVYVATWPTSNRLVQGGYFSAADSPTGSNGSRSTVFFSDAGAPDTYTSSNFVHLRPGDGEVITAIIPWREMLFVFKQTACFVFTGESVDATGNPIFSYRRIDLPSTMVAIPGLYTPVAAAEPDGVYFYSLYNGGVYRTSGDTPVPVGASIAPIFNGTPLVASSLRHGAGIPTFSIAGNWMFVVYTNADGNVRTLVGDRVSGEWTLWSVSPGSGEFIEILGEPAYVSGNDVLYMTPTATTDNGTTITWSYQSGWYDFGAPDQEKQLRRSLLTGIGTVTLSRFRDYQTTDANAGSVALGSTTTTEPHPKSWRGTLMSHKVSGAGAASVSSLSHEIRTVRAPGLRSPLT